MAGMASSSVAGTYFFRSDSTESPVLGDVPRLPWIRLFRYVRYCTGSGRSKPHLARYAATIAGFCWAVSDRFVFAGSPGTAWTSKNVRMVTPSSSPAVMTSFLPTNRRRVRDGRGERACPEPSRSGGSVDGINPAAGGCVAVNCC